LSKLGKKLEDMFGAASFAEEGEPEIAREIMDGRKKVVLVMTGRPSDTRSLKHALNMAIRNGADIEALVTCDPEVGEAALRTLETVIKDQAVRLTVSHKGGCIREAIVSHARRRSDILCVVVESEEILDIQCSHKHKKRDGIWRELTCPLSLVSERGSA